MLVLRRHEGPDIPQLHRAAAPARGGRGLIDHDRAVPLYDLLVLRVDRVLLAVGRHVAVTVIVARGEKQGGW